MQLKDQIRRNWKVTAAVTAVTAIGITGLAMADPGRGSSDPDPINLNDRTPITEVTTAKIKDIRKGTTGSNAQEYTPLLH